MSLEGFIKREEAANPRLPPVQRWNENEEKDGDIPRSLLDDFAVRGPRELRRTAVVDLPPT